MSSSDLKVQDYEEIKRGIIPELNKVNLDWDARVYEDSLISGLDSLIANNKNVDSNRFNRSLFTHLLEFGKFPSANPIQVSEFINTYFLAYDSMKENKISYATKCNYLYESINKVKNELVGIKQKEVMESNGRTNLSCMRFEVKQIQVFSDLEDTNLDHVFEGNWIQVDNYSKEEIASNGLIKIPLSNNTIQVNPSFEYSQKDINQKFSIFFVEKNKKIKLCDFEPKECFDFYSQKCFEIPDKGYIYIDYIFINSKVDFWTKKITEYEANYQESHATFDNLCTSINHLEEPFNNFFQTNSRSRQEDNFKDPAENEVGKQTPGILPNFERRENEISEKIEQIVQGVSGKKYIVWESIYFMFNKIMLGFVIFSFLNRGDFATVSNNIMYLIFSLFFLLLDLLLKQET